MIFRGRHIDPIKLWSEYCEIQEDEGPFLPLTHCPNPDHDNTRSPAFQVNIDQPTVHCFAYCGISGSYEHAVCIIEGLYEKHRVFKATDEREREKRKRSAYREARKRIFGIARTRDKTIPSGHNRKKVRKRSAADNSHLSRNEGLETQLRSYSYLPPVATDYFDSRGISSRSVATVGAGWDSREKRIVIPLRDERERLVGFAKRAVRPQDHPKYLYTEGFDRNFLLFGACHIDPGLVRSEGMILVEGSLDWLRLHSLGYRTVCAILGSYISTTHVEIIARKRPKSIHLMFDKDAAGIRAILNARQRLSKFPLYVCRYPVGKNDPAELTREEVARSLSKALPMLQFLRKLPEGLFRREEYRVG